jgi:tight adherence protein B
MFEFVVILVVALGAGAVTYLALANALPANGAAAVTHTGARARKALIQFLPRRTVLTVIAAALVAAILWGITDNPLMGIAALVACVALPHWYYKRSFAKRIALLDSQVPDLLAMTAGTMRAGASLMSALESVARDGPIPIRTEIDMVLREVRVGTDMDEALDQMAARLRSNEMIMVAAAIKIARASGGNLSESLEKLAFAVRDRQNMEKKILALTAQGRMQALVMAGLPFILLYSLFQFDPVAMAPMFHSFAGWAVFGAASFWIALGFKAIKKIMDIDI